MKFEIGKKYAHGTNRSSVLSIVGEAKTRMWGDCLIGEDGDSELCAIGRDEANTQNWVEISEQEYINWFLKPRKSKRIFACDTPSQL
jgi:hypothetical protein